MPKTINGTDTMSVEEAARRLGIGRTLAYELAQRGELPGALRLGRRFVVTIPKFNEALGLVPNVTQFPTVDEASGPAAA